MNTFADKPARSAALFTQPVRQIVVMLGVVVLFSVLSWLIYPAVRDVFLANPWLNGVIGLAFLIGVASCFWQIVQIAVSVAWIEDFAAQRPGFDYTSAPRLLAPLATLLRSRGTHGQISATSGRSILESVATRIDEARDITRYLANLLIFLGLLGTFYGLATTVPGVVETIRALAPKNGETAVEVFQKLMSGLEMQLGGMGTAFSSSLLGLAGSLVVGLLELFAGHGQNRFYRELEEWLTSITRLGFAGSESEGEGGDPGAVLIVLERMMERLEVQEARANADRATTTAGMEQLAEGFRALAEQGRNSPTSSTEATLLRIAEGQERLLDMVGHESTLGSDAEARMRLRSIDVQLLRILEEISAGRQESMADLRADLGALTQALRQLSRSAGR